MIGSSHVAAVKSAWDEIETQHPHIKVEFVPVGGKKFSATKLRPDMRWGLPDAMLKDTTIMASSRRLINLSAFDHVWHVGIWQAPIKAINDIIFDMNIDGFAGDTKRHSLSRAAFEAVVEDLTLRIMPRADWHHWSALRLWYSTIPRRNAVILKRKRFQDLDLRNHGPVWDYVDATLQTHMSQADITCIAQPRDTLETHGFTDIRYAATRTSSDGVDVQHMNTAFGKRMWDSFLHELPAHKTSRGRTQ